MKPINNLYEKVVALCKRRGFVFPGSEIYGGLANTYEYGPLGAQMLRNIRDLWWREFVERRQDMVGLDSSVILHPKAWEASGHVASFADAMIDCRNCQHRMRADHLVEDYLEQLTEANRDRLVFLEQSEVFTNAQKKMIRDEKKVEGLSEEQLDLVIDSLGLACPKCGEKNWTRVRRFNLLFETEIGIVKEGSAKAYLRGETAQGIFLAFKNVMDSTRVKLPFGIGQIGKSFRNEITPGNFIFRTLEFEQAEIEYFFDPEKENWEELYEQWKKAMWEFINLTLGIRGEYLRWRVHSEEERSFYSKRTEDLEYKFPFGFKELWGLAYRTDYDLNQHMQFSGQDLRVVDSATSRKFLPHVIEPAVGVNRLFMMLLCDAYREEEIDGETRSYLTLNIEVAPIQVAVFPLLANKPDLVGFADDVYATLSKEYRVAWDDRGNIGKRYRAQDEIGTPYCVTIDFQSLEDKTVTVRDRDTMTQTRVGVEELANFLLGNK